LISDSISSAPADLRFAPPSSFFPYYFRRTVIAFAYVQARRALPGTKQGVGLDSLLRHIWENRIGSAESHHRGDAEKDPEPLHNLSLAIARTHTLFDALPLSLRMTRACQEQRTNQFHEWPEFQVSAVVLRAG
jgi:hypothetical protein